MKLHRFAGKRIAEPERADALAECIDSVRGGEPFHFRGLGGHLVIAFRCGDELCAFDCVIEREGTMPLARGWRP